MRRTENECVDCGKPCLGRACPFSSVTRYYCDQCGAETLLYDTDEGELCAECVLDNLTKVEGSY